jgi:cysteinyl-tRNA synthetase
MRERFDAAMRDDFKTPEAIATIFEFAKRAQRQIFDHPETAEEFSSLAEALRDSLTILGFDLEEEAEDEVGGIRLRYPTGLDKASLNYLVQQYILRRDKARDEHDWAVADRLREEMRSRGWEIEDNPEYTRIYPAKNI